MSFTPGPWSYQKTETGGYKIVPAGKPDFVICRIANAITYIMDFDEAAEDDAHRIVTAVNAFDDMKAALTACQKALAMMTSPASIAASSVQHAWTTAIAAEAKARTALCHIGKPDGAVRACTCHPSDNPPVPCAQKFAYSECVGAAAETSPGDVLAMKGACKRIVVSFRHQVLPADRAMLRKIEAAIDRIDVKAEAKSQEPDAVAIKPLEWSDHEGDGVQVADAVTGEYRVRCHGGEFWVVARDGIPLSNRPYELASFAKAAAQADYEQRIRAALIHPTTKPEAPASTSSPSRG